MADQWDQYATDDWEQYSTVPVKTTQPISSPIIGQKSNDSPIMPGVSSTENNISTRGNSIQDLIKDPTTLDRFIKHPLGTSLRTIGGAFDYLEGVPASIAIDLQKGKPEDILSNLRKVATGERIPQRGDILRNLGINEFTSSTVGLLSGGAKLSPDSALGRIILENKAVTGLTKAISTVGVNGLSKIISVAGGIPRGKVMQALDNPNFLSNSWINKNYKILKNKYDEVVNPLINDNSKRVNTKSLQDITEELGIIQKNGDFTKAFESMNGGEKRDFLNWEKKINKGDMSFNEADSLIGQMDTKLKSVYKLGAQGKSIDYSQDFIRNTSVLRDKLKNVMKVQYPEFANVNDPYATVLQAKNVYSHFDRSLPHFLPAITVNAGAALLGGIHAPVLFGAATLGAIPKVQATGIKTISELIKQSSVTGKGKIGKYLTSSGIKAQGINRLLGGTGD